MKALVITLFVLTIVLLIVLRLYVIWWNKQPYCPRDEKTKRLTRIHRTIKGLFEIVFCFFLATLVICGLIWILGYADAVIVVI